MSERVLSAKMSISLSALSSSLRGRHLRAHLAQEVLLARAAHDVVVGVAVAHVVERAAARTSSGSRACTLISA